MTSAGAAARWPCAGEDPDDPDQPDVGGSEDLATEEEKEQLAPPPMYKVVLLNDDYTPMEFVVEVLEKFFQQNREKATQIMLTVHTKGKATCGVYTKDVADTKAMQVNRYAREHDHPLLCEVESS